MFKHIEGDVAILKQGGVYKTADLYEWRGGLYAKAAGGYVRLNANGTTTRDGVNIESLVCDKPLFKDRFGRIELTPGAGSKALMLDATTETLKLTEIK